MLAHSVPNGRGEVGLMPCPGCGGHHRSIYRLAGIPVLECPSAPPNVMHLMRVHGQRGGLGFVINIGPEYVAPDATQPVVETPPDDAHDHAKAVDAEYKTKRRTA